MSFKRLASGNQQSGTITPVYTVPQNSTANVSRFVLTNLTASDIGVTVYVHDGTDNRLITGVTIPAGLGRGVNVFKAFDSYNGGDIISLNPDSSNSFDYIISGREN